MSTRTERVNKWTPEEDKILTEAFQQTHEQAQTTGSKPLWKNIARRVHGRSAKQCRERWANHLNVSNAPWTDFEDAIIMYEYPKQWGQIAKSLHGRSRAGVRKRWREMTSLKNIDVMFQILSAMEGGIA